MICDAVAIHPDEYSNLRTFQNIFFSCDRDDEIRGEVSEVI